MLPASLPDQPDSLRPSYLDAFRHAKASVAIEITLATPEWAQSVIEQFNPRNRKASAALARRLRDVIAGGRWQFNGEAVVFDRNGRLLDGQHRLMAIAASGVPVPLLVVRGVDPKAFTTYDQGKIRNRADVLSIPTNEGDERAKNTTHLASALAYVYRWENGCLELLHRFPDNTEILDLNTRHSGVHESVQQSISRSIRGIHSPSLFGALHYIFGLKDKAAAESFFEKVWDHTDVEKGSNEAVLNKWLEGRKPRAGGPEQLATLACVIKTWNRVRAGEPAPGVLKFSQDERFPEIK